MPLTTYHLATGLLVGFLLRKHLYWPTLIISTVVVDVEPLLVLLGVLRDYPLHGYLHTFLASAVFGVAVGYATYALRSLVHPLFRRLHLAEEEPTATGSLLGGVVGWVLHVAMDSPVYSDIRPLLPLQYNPLYVGYVATPGLLWDVVLVCGLLTYFTHLYRVYRRGADGSTP
jgi:hypothetical protein